MSNALTSHEEAITKMKVALVQAIVKEEAEIARLKNIRSSIIDEILLAIPHLLKDNRYSQTCNINTAFYSNKLSSNGEIARFIEELKAVLSDLHLNPVAHDGSMQISKQRLIALVDAQKLALLL